MSPSYLRITLYMRVIDELYFQIMLEGRNKRKIIYMIYYFDNVFTTRNIIFKDYTLAFKSSENV